MNRITVAIRKMLLARAQDREFVFGSDYLEALTVWGFLDESADLTPLAWRFLESRLIGEKLHAYARIAIEDSGICRCCGQATPKKERVEIKCVTFEDSKYNGWHLGTVLVSRHQLRGVFDTLAEAEAI